MLGELNTLTIICSGMKRFGVPYAYAYTFFALFLFFLVGQETAESGRGESDARGLSRFVIESGRSR